MSRETAPVKRRIPRWARWLIVALLIVPFVGLYLREEVLYQRLDQVADCLKDWGTLFSEGQAEIDAANDRRIEELDELVRMIPMPGSDRSGFDAQRQRYVEASDAYDRAVRNNPGPPPPDDQCPT